jgi:hypothetical protein
MTWTTPAKACPVTMAVTFFSVNHRPEKGRQFFCNPFEVNEMATIMFGS